MEEETLYADGTNWITNQRLIFGDAQYPLGDAINAELKADYPRKVMLARVAIVVALVIAFGAVILVRGKSDDPFFEAKIAIANIIAVVGSLIVYIYMLRADYVKQPSLRKAILNIVLFMVTAAVYLLLFAFPTESSPLAPFWVVSSMAGLAVWRVLSRRGTFRISMIERTRTVEEKTSTDRQLVENLLGYIRLALVKHAKLTPAGVTSRKESARQNG